MSRRSVQAELGDLRQQELILQAIVVLRYHQTVSGHSTHNWKR